MSDGGKSSAPRPFSVGHDIFAKQFEAIFGKKNENNISAECTVAETRDECAANPKEQTDKFEKTSP